MPLVRILSCSSLHLLEPESLLLSVPLCLTAAEACRALGVACHHLTPFQTPSVQMNAEQKLSLCLLARMQLLQVVQCTHHNSILLQIGGPDRVGHVAGTWNAQLGSSHNIYMRKSRRCTCCKESFISWTSFRAPTPCTLYLIHLALAQLAGNDHNQFYCVDGKRTECLQSRLWA